MDEARSPAPIDLTALIRTPAGQAAGLTGVLTLLLGLLARREQPDPASVPLIASDGRLYFIVGHLMVVAVGYWVYRLLDAPRAGEQDAWIARYVGAGNLATSWIIPASIVFAAMLYLVHHREARHIVAITMLALSGAFAAITIRENLTAADPTSRRVARVAQVGLTAVVAFLTLGLIYLFKARMAYTAPVVFVVAALLIVQAHDGVPAFAVRRIAYALVGAVMVAEATWGLGYWPPAGWYGGGVLAAVFLGNVLIAGAQLRGRLNRHVVVQAAGSAAALLIACAWLAR